MLRIHRITLRYILQQSCMPKTYMGLHPPPRQEHVHAMLAFSYFPVRNCSFSRCVRLFSWLYRRSGAEGDGREFDAGGINADGSPSSNAPTPLDSPTDGGGGRGGGVVARGYGSEDGGLMPLPIGPPPMQRVNSSSSLTG